MEGSIKSIIDGFKNYYTLFLFFPIITIIRTREQFRLFTQIIIIIGLLNVLVYFFQFATGTVLPASSGSWDHGVFRVNHPGFNVIPIAMLLILGRILYPASNSNPILNYFILLVFIAAFFVSVSKGSITASLVSILVVLAYHNRSKIQNFLLYVFLGLIGIVLSFIILINIFHFRASSITERFSDEIENVGEDGSSSQVRGEMIGTKMEYILLNHPIFGVGFVYYKPEEGEKKWKYYKNPIAVVGDATYQNIVIVTGYLGLIFWLLNLYKSFLLGKKIFKKVNDPFLKSVAIALIGIPIFGLLHGFSSNYFSTRGFIFITIMSSYTFLLFKFTLQEFQKNENSHT
ncbi:MAG: O-antigen ligase family protein [Bacteroidales bacterium]|nr:O-antigen ligase family protein [Bacteroidales bacterium]